MIILEDFYESLNMILQNKELDKLEPYFIQSLEDAREVNNYTLYLTISNEMVAYYKSLGNSEKESEAVDNIIILMDELQKNILDAYENNNIKSDMVALSISLAFDYLKYHQLTKSKNSFMLTIDILEKNNMQQADYYCAALTGLGELHYKLKEYDLSVSFYEKALKYIEEFFGLNESYVMICDNLAAIYQLVNNQDQASYYSNKSLSIRKNKWN